MKRLFMLDLKRSFLNIGFAVGICFVFAILFPPLFFDSPLDGSRSYLHTLGNVFHASGFTPIAPAFPVLAYATIFCEEYQSGYLRMIVSRAGFKNFARVRITTVALSGGAMLAVPIGIVCLIAHATGMHGLPTGIDEGLLRGSAILYYAETFGDWFVLLCKVILGFLGGALWALVGLCFAVWITNRYVALLAPIILYESMWFLLDGTPLSPSFALIGESGWGDYPTAALVTAIYITVTVLLTVKGMRRAAHG